MSSSDDTDESPRPPAKPAGKPAGGGGGGGGLADGPCAIVEDTVVNSPDRTVVTTIRPEDVLHVVYDRGPPRILRVVTAAGSTLGSLTPPSLPQIISCIEGGHSYVAIVIDARGGRIAVQVRPA